MTTAVALLLVSAMSCWFAVSSASAASPTVTISPAGPYHDGETVTVSVGPNSVFTPDTKVNILECADPGGTPANLPSSDKSCDGQTIQNGTLYVDANGVLTESGYVLYKLPNKTTLEETASSQPLCDQSNACVLFIGVSQNDFGQPHLFSQSFAMGQALSTTGASTSATASGSESTTNVGGAAASPTAKAAASSGVSAGVTLGSAGSEAALSSSQLAFTGVPPTLRWTAATGAFLLLAGLVARRRILRGRLLGNRP